jgi:hypothetical protein
MTDEKDSQNQDTSALELQIEQMIDDLFVSREEPVADEIQEGPAAPAGDQGTLVFPSEAKDIGTDIDFVPMTAQTISEKPSMKVEPETGVREEARPTDSGTLPKDAQIQQPAVVTLEAAGAGLQAFPVTDSLGEPGPVIRAPDSTAEQHYNSLKENMLSVEWEISPQNIDRFLDAMKPVQEHLAGNPSAMKASSMMVGVLSYIRRIGRSALPLSIQVLQNGVDYFGTLLLPEEQTNGEKRKELLGIFVDHYRVLKFQIEQQRDKVQAPKARPIVAQPMLTPELTEYIKKVVDDTVRSVVDATLESEVQKLKQEIMQTVAREVRTELPASTVVEPAQGSVVEAPETNKEEVLTVSLGEQHFNIPKALVANVYSPVPRKLAKVLKNRSFRIADLISFFGSATKGLMGPLAMVSASEVRNRTFDLVDTDRAFGVPGYLQPRQLVLISDGMKGFGLLVDAATWRTVEVPRDFVERIETGGDSFESVLKASQEEYPFLNVGREL